MTDIAVVGATGLVGKTFIKLLEERDFPFDNLHLYASAKNSGRKIRVKGRYYTVRTFSKKDFEHIDIAFYSCGSQLSKTLVPEAASMGTVCIDNSSAFRMNKKVPLIVPEINFKAYRQQKIIANPNCSTIQLTLALDCVMHDMPVSRIDVSTYQAVSGAGRDLLETYRTQAKGKKGVLDIEIFDNVIQSIGKISSNGSNEEEIKIVNETRKIMGKSKLNIGSTCMRVPVSNTHVESVTVRFRNEPDMPKLKKLLQNNTNGVKLVKETVNSKVSGSDTVFVSRLRRDLSDKKTVSFIVSADNLRVGAALNGIRIAERLLK